MVNINHATEQNVVEIEGRTQGPLVCEMQGRCVVVCTVAVIRAFPNFLAVLRSQRQTAFWLCKQNGST